MFFCSRSGEARRALRDWEEGGNQDHQPGEAKRICSHEGTYLSFSFSFSYQHRHQQSLLPTAGYLPFPLAHPYPQSPAILIQRLYIDWIPRAPEENKRVKYKAIPNYHITVVIDGTHIGNLINHIGMLLSLLAHKKARTKPTESTNLMSDGCHK